MRIQVRRGTSAQWAAVNPVLETGEFGYATDGKVLKIGDGAGDWLSLPTVNGVSAESVADAVAAWLDEHGSGSSGPIAWTEVTGKPTVFPPSVHTHTASSITDFVESVQDVVASLIVAGTNVAVSYNDAANTLTINASGGSGGSSFTAEDARDALGAALVAGVGINIVADDAGDTITVAAAVGTAAGTVAAGNHSHAQYADVVLWDGTAVTYNGAAITSWPSGLTGPTLVLGFTAAGDVPGWIPANGYVVLPVEAGSGGSGFTAEDARDAIGAALVAGTNIDITVNDAGDTITIGTTGLGNAATRNVGASAGTVAAGDDARLSDSRTPTAHTHAASQISDSSSVGRSILTAADAAAVRSASGAAASNAPGLLGRYVSINAQTGVTYTPVLGDEGTLVTCTNAAAITVTLPQNSALAFPIGGRIDFAGLGAGLVTFAAGTGATVNGTPGLTTRAQYSAVSVVKVSTNGWLVVGDLA